MTEQTNCITNAWELLEGKETDWLLTINGFSKSGGDYACFCRFLSALARMERLSVAPLSRLLGTREPLCQDKAGVIWKQVAEELLLTDPNRDEVAACLQEWMATLFAPHSVLMPEASVCDRLLDVEKRLLPSGESWKQWATLAKQELEKALGQDTLPFLTLPAGFFPVRVSLYQAERVLMGQNEPPAVWRTQLACFLFDFCRERGLRPVLRVDCEYTALLELLAVAARRGSLPPLILQSKAPTQEELLTLCQCVMQHRQVWIEGEPPILWSPLEPSGVSVAPKHLTVRLPNQIV